MDELALDDAIRDAHALRLDAHDALLDHHAVRERRNTQVFPLEPAAGQDAREREVRIAGRGQRLPDLLRRCTDSRFNVNCSPYTLRLSSISGC
jgi:hypothetical protein